MEEALAVYGLFVGIGKCPAAAHALGEPNPPRLAADYVFILETHACGVEAANGVELAAYRRPAPPILDDDFFYKMAIVMHCDW